MVVNDETELYSIYKNILLMDIGSDSGKVCLELSRGLTAWSSVVYKERKHKKVMVVHFWKAREPACSQK